MCAIELGPVITTERLRLRAPRMADAPVIAGYCSDFDVARMTARIPHPYDLADAEGFLGLVASRSPLAAPHFAIEHLTEGLLGMIALFEDDFGRPEMGYWLGRPHWGKGYATEVVKATLGWAAVRWGRRFVMAGHFIDNPASGVVLTKAGFLYTGEVKLSPCAARGEAQSMRTMVWMA